MSRHATVEKLSEYLDDELTAAERGRVESHLEECGACRDHLAGLRRVVGRLEVLRRAAPPAHLGQQIEHRVRLETRRPRFQETLERGLDFFGSQSTLAPAFALVVALAAILYMFSWGVERYREPGTQIVIETPSGRAAAGEVAEATTRRLGGRDFERLAGAWVERGSESEPVAERLDLSALDAATLGREHPGLAPFAALGGVVRLRRDGVLLEVVFPPPPAGPEAQTQGSMPVTE